MVSDVTSKAASGVPSEYASAVSSAVSPETASNVLSKSASEVPSDGAGHIAGRIAGLNESAMPSVVAYVVPSDVASSASRCPSATQASLRNHKGIPERYINFISA